MENGNILIELTKSDHKVIYNNRKFPSLIYIMIFIVDLNRDLNRANPGIFQQTEYTIMARCDWLMQNEIWDYKCEGANFVSGRCLA